MRKLNLTLSATVILVAMLFVGCGLSKMVKKYKDVSYEVTPKVLETHGGKIVVTITGRIPAKYFHPSAVVELIPVLKYEGGEHTLKSQFLRGEKSTDTRGIPIPKATGGSFSYTDTIPFKMDMKKAELKLNVKATLKKKEVNLSLDQKLADGVIYTSTRVMDDDTPLFENDKYVKVSVFPVKATIWYAYAKHNLDMNLALNKKAEAKLAIKNLDSIIRLGYKIKNIEVNAWASPEGEVKYNQDLSDNRAKTADKFINDLRLKIAKSKAKELKIKEKDVKLDSLEMPNKLMANGEDWNGFTNALNASDITEKTTILNVVNAQPDLKSREQEIRNMAVIYKQIEDKILPELRRAEIVVNFYEPKKTDAEMATLSTTAPDQLQKEELFYAASLTEDMNTKLAIYTSCTQRFADDWRGYNNAAYACLKLNKVDEAKTFIEKAYALQPNNAIVLNNMGIVANLKKDYVNAEKYFNEAKAKGANANYSLAVLEIRKGNYEEAIKLFAGMSCKYNISLAQLLSGNPAGAATTLDCTKDKTAAVYYLMAIIGARTNNAQMMNENLKKACSMDASYKAQAKDDREFLSFFTNADFQAAIQ